jgi:glycosyltransferase involved in cell wall biosynthesis
MIRAAHPHLRLCVVGQRPAAAVQALSATPGVEIAGPVADVRPWFAHAAAYVLPMRVGGGVRLKLLETWAMELPCITTTLGAEGVDGFEPGVHALIADDPHHFATHVLSILANPEQGQALAVAGRHLVTERYDWAPIVSRMEQSWSAHLQSGR